MAMFILKSIVKTMFEDANNYMKDGVYLRQVIDVIDEIELHLHSHLERLNLFQPKRVFCS